MPNPETVWLTENELADRWKCSRGALRNARSQGRGVPYAKIGGCVRYDLADVLAYEERSISGRVAA